MVVSSRILFELCKAGGSVSGTRVLGVGQRLDLGQEVCDSVGALVLLDWIYILDGFLLLFEHDVLYFLLLLLELGPLPGLHDHRQVGSTVTNRQKHYGLHCSKVDIVGVVELYSIFFQLCLQLILLVINKRLLPVVSLNSALEKVLPAHVLLELVGAQIGRILEDVRMAWRI